MTRQIRLTGILLALAAALSSKFSYAAAADVTPAIAGVVNAETPITLVKDGFEAVEGPMPQPDGGLLFTNNRAGRILQIAPDGQVSVWFEGAGGPNALTRTPKGEVVATLNEALVIGVVRPGEAPRVLIPNFEGKAFNRPNDLVADSRGNLYFTDSIPPTATAPPVIPSALYQLTTDGRLIRIASDITRPNGVALSPDEQTLYVANTAGEWIYAYALDSKGLTKERREFARLAVPPPQNGTASTSGADGIAVDEKGRVFVATALGVQVVSAAGQLLGTIAMPKQPQNLAFAGPDRNVLYVVGRGAVYRITTLTRGPDRPRK